MYQIMFKSPLEAAKINIGEEKDWTGAFSFHSSNDISPDRIFIGISFLVSNLIKKNNLCTAQP